MSFNSSTPSRRSTKSSIEDFKTSDIIIRKPKKLSEKCPIVTQTTRPYIATEKKIERIPQEDQGSLESSRYWLKPGISIPKMKLSELNASKPGKKDVWRRKSLTPDESLHSLSNVSEKSCLFGSAKKQPSIDFNSEPVGPSLCQFDFAVDPPDFDFNNLKVPEEELEPSHALQNWELWLKRKKKMQDFLSKRLGKFPCDLLINRLTNFRKIVEDKVMLTYAQIPEGDKWRGHPFFWKPEPRLGERSRDYIDCCDVCPVYFSTKSNWDKGIVPEMEFIGVPTAVQREKGLVCVDAPKSPNSTIKDWEDMSYRREKFRRFRKQIKRMKPHEIQLAELAIVGTRIQPKTEAEFYPISVSEDLPEIHITDYERDRRGEEKICECHPHDRKSVACLVINGDEFKVEIAEYASENSSKISENSRWHVNFGLIPVGNLAEGSIKVENRGTMAVSYHWVSKKLKQKQSLYAVPSLRHAPWFFFNKNSGIFLPGQTYDLKFYHRTHKAGVRTETWFLKTKPDLFENSSGGEIILSAVGVEEFSDAKTQDLERYVKRRIGESLAKSILDCMLYVAADPVHGLTEIEYRSYFSEKELFEYHNPKHYYHSEVVNELRDIFREIPLIEEMEWDLSLHSLLKLINDKTAGNFQNELLCKVAHCGKKLLRPSYNVEMKDKKHWMAYQIFCKMTNYMEHDYNNILHSLAEKREPKEKIEPDYEEFETASSSYSKSEESLVTEPKSIASLYEINPINLIHFQTMFYLKVYHRLCDAVENIAGTVETCKLMTPWKKIPKSKFGSMN